MSSTAATARVARAVPRQRAGRAALRLVAATPRAARRTPFVVVVTGMLVMGLMGLLILNTLAAQDAFRLHDLRERSAGLSDQEQALALAAAQAQSPTVLAEKARALGMYPGGDPAFLRLHDGRLIGAIKPVPPPPPPAKPVASKPAATGPTTKPASSRPASRPARRCPPTPRPSRRPPSRAQPRRPRSTRHHSTEPRRPAGGRSSRPRRGNRTSEQDKGRLTTCLARRRHAPAGPPHGAPLLRAPHARARPPGPRVLPPRDRGRPAGRQPALAGSRRDASRRRSRGRDHASPWRRRNDACG